MLFNKEIEGLLINAGNFFELDDIQPELAALNFGDIRLRSIQLFSGVILVKLRLITGFFQAANQVGISFSIDRFIHIFSLTLLNTYDTLHN